MVSIMNCVPLRVEESNKIPQKKYINSGVVIVHLIRILFHKQNFVHWEMAEYIFFRL